MQHDTPTTRERIGRIIGLGVDGHDGHIRFTSGHGFELLNGSEESHELMQRWCLEIERRLAAMGREMGDLSSEEFLALARDAAPRP